MSYPAYYHRKIEQFWFLSVYCHYCRHSTTLGWSSVTLILHLAALAYVA